jgi:hypothetical protein
MGECEGLVSLDLADSRDSIDSVSLGSTVPPTLGFHAISTPREDLTPPTPPEDSSPMSPRLALD